MEWRSQKMDCFVAHAPRNDEAIAAIAALDLI
jgi:hypothetical protein